MTRRPFEVSDHALWDEIKRNVLPLGRRNKPTLGLTLGPSPQLFGGTAATTRPMPAVIRRKTETANPPPLTAFDRRLAQRLLRGQIEPDARLDLHGDTLETSRMRLFHFLQARYHDGSRLVLVITGKGGTAVARHTLHGREHFHAPEREGRLRREIPSLLHEAAFRNLVIGFQPAHPRHGGGGAIYVRLRRNHVE
jgi:DNA-nicking Smr family endonuclease